MRERKYKLFGDEKIPLSTSLMNNGVDISQGSYYVDEEGIYLKRSDGNVYPLSHPDLSTQPSILPQRFGNMPLHELLCPLRSDGVTIDTSLIPSDAIIIEVSAFNQNMCKPVVAKKDCNKWSIVIDDSGFVPDYALVRYYATFDGMYKKTNVYYGYFEGLIWYYDSVLKCFTIDGVDDKEYVVGHDFMSRVRRTTNVLGEIRMVVFSPKICTVCENAFANVSTKKFKILGDERKIELLGDNQFTCSHDDGSVLEVSKNISSLYDVSPWNKWFKIVEY